MTKTFKDEIRTLEVFEPSYEGLESNDPRSPKYKREKMTRDEIINAYLLNYPHKAIGVDIGTITLGDMKLDLGREC